jgi:hypothetical protein
MPRRLHPLDDTDYQAAGQVRALLERLPASGVVPWFVFDGGYDSAQLSLDLAEERVAVLVRLRSDRCFYADPPPPPPGKIGRPRRHGAKFNCADPASWPTPTATPHTSDDQYGSVTVAAWSGLHPKQQRHPGHGSRGPRPIVRGTVIRVQVERVPARTRPPKVLWLWWSGPGELDLDLAWRAYVRRFDCEIVCTQQPATDAHDQHRTDGHLRDGPRRQPDRPRAHQRGRRPQQRAPPERTLEPRGDPARDRAPGRERRDVQPARGVAQVEFVA